MVAKTVAQPTEQPTDQPADQPAGAEQEQPADEEDAIVASIDDDDRSQPVNLGPERGGNLILQGWDGLYWIFGARAETFDVTHDGVVVVGLTLPTRFHLRTILRDMRAVSSSKRPRLDLIPQVFWAHGETPEQIVDPAEASAWTMQFLRTKDEEGSFTTPDYAKKAVADYKKRTGIAVARGRKRKTLKFDLDSLNSLNPDTLAGVGNDQLEALRNRIEEAMAKQKNQEADLLPA